MLLVWEPFFEQLRILRKMSYIGQLQVFGGRRGPPERGHGQMGLGEEQTGLPFDVNDSLPTRQREHGIVCFDSKSCLPVERPSRFSS